MAKAEIAGQTEEDIEPDCKDPEDAELLQEIRVSGAKRSKQPRCQQRTNCDAGKKQKIVS